MASNQDTTRRTGSRVGEAPVLRPGRPADPRPGMPPASTPSGAAGQAVPATTPAPAVEGAAGRPVVPQAVAGAEEEAGKGAPAPTGEESAGQDVKEGGARQEGASEIERALAESRQRKLRLMLRQCDRVLLLDFNLLAMSDWPDNYTMAAARRRRDLWLFGALIAAMVFVSGLTGFVPAWIAGGGFGAFAVILLLGVPMVRRIYTSRLSYLDLIMLRQRLLRDACKHIEHLEGQDGLIWQCARMAEFNPALKATRFSNLLALSERRVLARYLNRREHIRLYLIYLLEAEKGYGRAQQAFFDGNHRAIDRGWASVAAEPEAREPSASREPSSQREPSAPRTPLNKS